MSTFATSSCGDAAAGLGGAASGAGGAVGVLATGVPEGRQRRRRGGGRRRERSGSTWIRIA
ncbi:hypothetical protein ACFSLT_12175 [Novosphingobium resinovorum]